MTQVGPRRTANADYVVASSIWRGARHRWMANNIFVFALRE
jgi:hypothetical protein